MLPPCVLHEDEHLLVVNKPSGWNTHAPAPHAGEGIYDWLRNRESRWETLAIIHRLDKETSGVLVFGKTPLANKSLTDQFAKREAHKRYLLLTQGTKHKEPFVARSNMARIGERYASRPAGEPAETRFSPADASELGQSGEWVKETGCAVRVWIAEPVTGRTHQIRVHASENGIPIWGDSLYGGPAGHRLMLHAAELTIRHPATNQPLVFRAPVNFGSASGVSLRQAIIAPEETDCYRLVHGRSDGQGFYLDRLGDFLLWQGENEAGLTAQAGVPLAGYAGSKAVYVKCLNRQVRRTVASDSSPRLQSGEASPAAFLVKENGLQYELSFQEGYSVGLFLDQRDNRRRLLTGYVSAGFPRFSMDKLSVLNTFAYTCGFSVAAAKAGASTTSLDLSKKYLEWGRRNLEHNGLDPAAHDFIYGDVFEWLKRLHRKGRAFDVILLDPPTFSQSKESGVFRADRDYPMLVELALSVLKPKGVIFASNNTATWAPSEFVQSVLSAVQRSRRRVQAQHYVPQPPDFPISKAEPAYLKTLWLSIA